MEISILFPGGWRGFSRAVPVPLCLEEGLGQSWLDGTPVWANIFTRVVNKIASVASNHAIKKEYKSILKGCIETLKNKLEIEKQLPSTPSVRLDVEEYTELHEELYKIVKLQLEYNTLNKLPKNSIVLDTVLEQLDSVKDIKTDLDKLTQFKKLTHITFPESVKVNNELFNEIRTLHENLETLKCLQSSGKNLVHALREKQELVKELKVELDKVEVCPLCGNSLKECGEEKWL